jgi:uncharacterized protein YqeY
LEQEERKQAEVIASFLPQQLSPDELQEAVGAIIRELGASSMADMGRVMATASTRLAGAADGKAISGVVRTLLSTASPS